MLDYIVISFPSQQSAWKSNHSCTAEAEQPCRSSTCGGHCLLVVALICS